MIPFIMDHCKALSMLSVGQGASGRRYQDAAANGEESII